MYEENTKDAGPDIDPDTGDFANSSRRESIDFTDDMPAAWKKTRERLLSEVEQKTEGLDLVRVREYFTQLGLEPQDFVIYDDENIDQVMSISEKAMAPELIESGLIYMPELRLIFLRRDYESEKWNGPVYTEGMLIHEMAHSTSMYNRYSIKGDDHDIYNVDRLGQSVAAQGYERGNYFEEGFCEMLRVEYTRQFQDPAISAKLVTQFFGSNPDNHSLESKIPSNDDPEIQYPLKYLFLHEKGAKVETSPKAGIGLEILCEQEPELLPSLIEARTSVEGLRRVAQLVNNISPDLYLTLRDLDDTDDGLAKGLKIISTIAN